MGWLGYLLVAWYLWRGRTADEEGEGDGGGVIRERPLAAPALAQIGIVAGLGLLRTETSRLWIFMMPLFAIPVGLELRRWSPRDRFVAIGCLWLILVTVCRNLDIYR